MDRLDHQIVHALQARGRAPFSLLGRVLDVSDQTVARRYARLRASAALRVVGVTDAALVGETQWYVRARVAPGSARAIAEAVARRPDTSWVRLISGGTEVVCATRARTGIDPDSLLARLPRTARVLDVTAQCELHVYSRGARRLLSGTGALSESQLGDLRAGDAVADGTATSGAVVHLDDTDRALLAALRRDARTPLEELAAVAGAPTSTVRQHLVRLRTGGVLRFDVQVDHGALGLGVLSLLWIDVAPADLDATGTSLADHPEVAFAAATTGPTNLYASVLTRDTADLHTYLTRRVASLPAVRHVETQPTVDDLKGMTLLVR